jgi:hypothetical protein
LYARVLAGRDDEGQMPEGSYSAIEEYDPSTDAWTERTRVSRAFPLAIDAEDGRVYMLVVITTNDS